MITQKRIPIQYRYLLSYVNPIRSIRCLSKNRKMLELERSSPEPIKILFSFTCDVELVPPFHGGRWEERFAKPTLDGLKKILDLLREKNIQATFFIEGIFCQKFSGSVGVISDEGHEIGSHGYAHETYAGWWIPRKARPPAVLSLKERREKIRKTSSILLKVTNKRPLSFRAPFSSIDENTLLILEEEGFVLDASVYNMIYDVPSKPYNPSRFNIKREGDMKIYEVPVAVSQYAYRRNLWCYYYELLSEICATDPEEALKHVQLASKLQALHGELFTVIAMTCHPWEFANTRIVPDMTLGRDRLESFKRFFGILKKVDNIEFMTLLDALQTYRKRAK
jgi:peptidoglycan/xylan/chitin deacetylase (PgdA/CDA1 family)